MRFCFLGFTLHLASAFWNRLSKFDWTNVKKGKSIVKPFLKMASITSSSHLLSAIIMDCPKVNSSIKPMAMSWRYMISGFLINRPTITLMHAPRHKSQYRNTVSARCAQCITIIDMQIFDMRDAHKARAWADYMWCMSRSMEHCLHTRIVLSSSTMMKHTIESI